MFRPTETLNQEGIEHVMLKNTRGETRKNLKNLNSTVLK